MIIKFISYYYQTNLYTLILKKILKIYNILYYVIHYGIIYFISFVCIFVDMYYSILISLMRFRRSWLSKHSAVTASIKFQPNLFFSTVLISQHLQNGNFQNLILSIENKVITLKTYAIKRYRYKNVKSITLKNKQYTFTISRYRQVSVFSLFINQIRKTLQFSKRLILVHQDGLQITTANVHCIVVQGTCMFINR